MIKTLITVPAQPAITLADIKKHLRIPDADTDSDARLTIYRDSAISNVENLTGRALITQTWDLLFTSWSEMLATVLPLGQLQSVTHIKYKDEDGDEQTVSSDDYLVDRLLTDEGQIVIQDDSDFAYPDIYDTDSITVRIVCGYGDYAVDAEGPPITVNSIPRDLSSAMLMHVEWLETGLNTGECVYNLSLNYTLWVF
jgi:uncharacterized phiE125 gp8 family phage protein